MFAVILLPDFALQAALRHEPALHSKPVALIDDRERNATIIQLTPSARAAGVEPGLTSTQAVARCSSVGIKSRCSSQEIAANDALLQCAFGFSPRVEATAPGVCTLDLQGLPGLQQAEGNKPSPVARFSSWAEQVIGAVAQFNLRAQIGIAATPNVALLAAMETGSVSFIEDATAFISSLPIERLAPEPGILAVLRCWGIRTVGGFTALGKDNIAERLGAEALELFERASPTAIRPLDMAAIPESFAESSELEVEVETLDPLLFILHRFVEQLSKRLALSYFVVEQLRLQLTLSSGGHYRCTLQVPSPTGNIEVLFRMLQTHLENVRTDSPIIALQLSATPCRGGAHQFGLFEVTLRNPNQFAETIARLNALCGEGCVGTPVVEDTHRPDAFRMEHPRFGSAPTVRDHKTSESCCGLRLRRFRPPLDADVEMNGGTPVFISTLKFTSPIANTKGPWRSSGDWWEKPSLWSRDEWDIQTRDGALYRIYRENRNWFLEGVYD